jgi:F-type H+-transporting ATPase subunit gamma
MKQPHVVVNTDKGLCGGLNSNIVKEAKLQARALEAAGKTVTFYLVGKKGRAPIKRDYPNAIAENFDTSTVRTPGFDEASAIAREVIAVRRGQVRRCPPDRSGVQVGLGAGPVTTS